MKLAPLARKNSQVDWEHTEKKTFNVTRYFCVVWDIPTKAIPHFAPAFAESRFSQALTYISNADVNGHGTGIKYVESFAAAFASRHLIDVLKIASPHFAVVLDERHRALLIMNNGILFR